METILTSLIVIAVVIRFAWWLAGRDERM